MQLSGLCYLKQHLDPAPIYAGDGAISSETKAAECPLSADSLKRSNFLWPGRDRFFAPNLPFRRI
jgi:hypothetical protein